MKVMERVKDQPNMRMRVGGHNLKFKHVNWNSKSSSNMYLEFEVKYEALLEINFRQLYIVLKHRKLGV